MKPKTKITSGFWHDRLEVNAQRAIFHQWEQLEASGCIENFRIVTGDVDGFREGWFFADSDAYKWLDAASQIYASYPNPQLGSVMDELIALLERAQQPDGYIFTYNQIHFPGMRWVNLQIEHELYCHGHLIEAGVSHFENTARTDMLNIARRAADRIVEDFLGKGTDHTPGHEEIELALLRLYQVTNHQPYLEMARQFIEQRGRNPLFALSVIRQNSSADARKKIIQQQKQEYLSAHPEFKPFQLPPDNAAKKPEQLKIALVCQCLERKILSAARPSPQADCSRWALCPLCDILKQPSPCSPVKATTDHSSPLLRKPGNTWSRAACTSLAELAHSLVWKALETITNSTPNMPTMKPAPPSPASSGIGKWRNSQTKPNTATCSNGSYTTPPQSAWDWTARLTFTTIRSPAAAA